MNKVFKNGDRVVLDMSHHMNNGRDYGAQKLRAAQFRDGSMTVVWADGGSVRLVGKAGMWTAARFKLAPAEASKVHPHGLQVGDTVRCTLGQGSALREGSFYDVSYVDRDYVGLNGATVPAWDYSRFVKIDPKAAGITPAPTLGDILQAALKSAKPESEATSPKAGEPVPSQFWITAVLGKDGKPQPAANPKVHLSASQASAVGKAMAEKHPGETFVTLMVTEAFHQPVAPKLLKVTYPAF